MLSADQIKALGLIHNTKDGCFAASTYDLRIGTIITQSGQEPASFILPPQGMVEVVSAERLKVPKEISGYATVKTSLCNEGILAINIGIIDPNYEGPISSTLINFSKSPHCFRIDDMFLRLTFHEYGPQKEFRNYPVLSNEEYVAQKRAKVSQHFSETFLDLNKTVQDLTKPVAENIFEEWKRGLFVYVPLAALILAVLAFLVTLGANYSSRLSVSKEQVKQEVTTELQTKYYKDLEERLVKLEQELQRINARVAEKAANTEEKTKTR